MEGKSKVVSMDTKHIRLDSFCSVEDFIEEALNDYKKISEKYKTERLNIKNR